MQVGRGKTRWRTIRLYRLTDDGRRLLAGCIKANSPAELVVHWRAYLTSAASGVYVAHYRGSTLALKETSEAAYVAMAA